MHTRPKANQVRYRLASRVNQTFTPPDCRLESVVSPKAFRLRPPRGRLRQMLPSPNRRPCPPPRPPHHWSPPLHLLHPPLNQRQPRFQSPCLLNVKLNLPCLNPWHPLTFQRSLNPLNRLLKPQHPTSRWFHLSSRRHQRLRPPLRQPLRPPLRLQYKLHRSDSKRLG
jgi:hypothetical protein